MKATKVLALLLAALMLLSGCAKGGSLILTGETGETGAPETGGETVTAAKRSVWSPMREIPCYELPAGAGPDEIRAMAVKAMRDELTVQWYSPNNFTYPNGDGTDMTVNSSEVYAGLPYTQSCSGLMQWLQYYDPETGEVTGISGADLNGRLGNSCASSVMWGWSGVVSSIDWDFTFHMTPGHGCLPVGGYKVDMGLMDYRQYTTTQIVNDNGMDAILRAYTQVQPADGLISYMDQKTSHAQMVLEPAHVEYKEDGSIDTDKSYILIQDQHKGILSNKEPFVTKVDGNRVHYAGHVSYQMKFTELYDKCYIPVTVAEFTGAKAYDVPRLDAVGAENITSIEDLKDVTLTSPYKIVVVRVTLKDGDTVFAESRTVLGKAEIQNGTITDLSLSKVLTPTATLRRDGEKGKTYRLVVEALLATGNSFTPIDTDVTYNG